MQQPGIMYAQMAHITRGSCLDLLLHVLGADGRSGAYPDLHIWAVKRNKLPEPRDSTGEYFRNVRSLAPDRYGQYWLGL
jgi:hypothetical protein